MNTTLAINKIYPELKFNIDFKVRDDGKGPILTWVNTEITQPTQAEIEAAWVEVEKETQLIALKQEKAASILKIASLTDQLNLTAGTLDVVVDVLAELKPEILEHSWVIESKTKLEEIKTILNN